MKKLLLIIILIMAIFQMVVLATTIDIGNVAIDCDEYLVAATTVAKDNPANESGTITSIEIWAVNGYNLINCEVATFSASGNNLTTRDTVTLGTVTSGSKQIIILDSESNPISLAVQAGDYIGIYFSAGRLEFDRETGTAGVWTLNGDQIPCDNTTFAPYAPRYLSLYGTGGIDNAIFFGINF